MSEQNTEREPTKEVKSNREELQSLAENQARPEAHKEQDPSNKERSIESAREKLRQSAERPSEREKVHQPKPVKRRRLVSAAERTVAYKSALHAVQQKLPPVQRQFSRLVHARFVEEASELLEETVYRPSFLLSGGIGAIVVGSTFYLVARSQEWALSGSEFTVSLLIGGILGWIGESIWKRIRTKTPRP